MVQTIARNGVPFSLALPNEPKAFDAKDELKALDVLRTYD